ncbi:MAG: shikimate dehydrogenase family protein, partial [Candidatus Aminicenantes bacterium]
LDHFSFISHVQGYPWKDSRIKEKTKQADLIINATPVGMYPFEDDSPLDLDFPVKKNLIAFDLIYNPQKTKFLEEARKKGIAIENGSRMLIYQAVESYKIWKNTQINEDFFIKSSEEVLHASLFKRR